MPLPFAGDPALLGQLLVGVSEVDQERRRRQHGKQGRSCLLADRPSAGCLRAAVYVCVFCEAVS